MKFFFKFIVMAMLSVLLVGQAVAATTCISNSKGDWNKDIWTNTTCKNGPPTGSDVVIGHKVKLKKGSTNVVANITINSGGTLQGDKKATLTLSGNFTNSGTFTANSGTVLFTGTNQTITGNVTFYKLTVTSTTLTIGANSSVTVSNTASINDNTNLGIPVGSSLKVGGVTYSCSSAYQGTYTNLVTNGCGGTTGGGTCSVNIGLIAPPNSNMQLNAVSGVTGLVVGVGEQNCKNCADSGVAYVNGAATTLPTTEQLNAVSVASSTYAVAVGNNGALVQFNGTAWSNMSTSGSSPGNDLNGVKTYGSNQTYVVGDDGIYFFNGSTWTRQLQTSSVPDVYGQSADKFVAIWGDATTLYALADNGALYSKSASAGGTSWTQKANPPLALDNANFNGISGDAAGNVYITGQTDNNQGFVYRFNSGSNTWTELITTTSTFDMSAVAVNPVNGAITAVGENGAQLVSGASGAGPWTQTAPVNTVNDINGVYISPSGTTYLAGQTTPGCNSPTGPDHYELSLPSTSINCLSTTVTVTACADSSNPCANVSTAATGTANLATTGGTIGTAALTAGVGTANLSYPGAAEGTSVTVSLTSATTVATNPTICLGGSCATIFNTAGFVLSSAADGAAVTIPTQVAGTSSGTYYLRAVKTNASSACESALTGPQTVDLGYECNDPTSCYAANMMSVNGSKTADAGWGAATTITRNNNGSHASTAPVNVTFDPNGNAPLTFVYSDVGKVTLWASKAAGGSLLAALTGSTLPAGGFLVKPFDFGVIPCAASVVGDCTVSPVDPGLTGGGIAFATAGKAFKATITARASGGLATPSFGLGSNNATETVSLTRTRVAPTSTGAVDGTLGGTTAPARSGFTNGISTISDLTWSEVGVITLTASNSTFLGSATSTTGTTGNVGRFIPDHFDTVVTGQMACATGLTCPASTTPMGYDSQVFNKVVVTARNGATTSAATANYTGDFAHNVSLRATNASSGSPPVTGGSLAGTTTVPAASFNGSGGSATLTSVFATNSGGPSFEFTRPLTPLPAPIDVYLNALDAIDGVTSGGTSSTQGGLKVVYGHLKIANAYGSELLTLPMKVTAQYYNGTSWVTSTTDSLSIPGGLTAIDVPGSTPPLCDVIFVTAPLAVASGVGSFTLTKPTNGRCDADITLSAPSYLPGVTGRATFGIYKSPLIYRRENY